MGRFFCLHLNSGRVLTPYFDKVHGLELYTRHVKHSKNFPSVYLEGTLYFLWISILDKRRDITFTP
jgi:hypothetical protein